MTPPNVAPVPDPADAPIAPAEDPDATDDANRDVGWDIVDQWGEQSFPASDPPPNW